MVNDPRSVTPAELDEATQHSAQHLLSATILRLFGVPTVSMRIGETYSTIDLDAPDLAPGALADAEAAMFDAIESDRPIRVHLCPPERLGDFPLRKPPPADAAVVRIIEIAGHDWSPCSGEHLPSTSRILALKIISAEKYKGMLRVGFLAGRRAFTDYRACRSAAERAAAALKTAPDKIDAGVAALLEQKAQADRYLLIAREALAAQEASRLLAGGAKAFVASFSDRSLEEALRVARAAQKLGADLAIVASTVERKAAALSSAPDRDLRPVLSKLLAERGGKGGGGPGQFQAAFTALADLEGFLAGARTAYLGNKG